jgi:hypothetical protein
MSNIKIGSWNLQNFAATTKKNINIVVEAILKFDLIALQEIRDKKGVEILVEKTGYNYWLSEPVGSSETTAHQTGKRKERYAFLWNNKIKVINTLFAHPLLDFFLLYHNLFHLCYHLFHLVKKKKKKKKVVLILCYQLYMLFGVKNVIERRN